MPHVNIDPAIHFDGDLHVLGLTEEGDVLQIGYGLRLHSSGENLGEWGIHNLKKSEVKNLLSLEGIREKDRQFLMLWRKGMSPEEGWLLADKHGF